VRLKRLYLGYCHSYSFSALKLLSRDVLSAIFCNNMVSA